MNLMGPRLWSTALLLDKSEFSVWPRELHCGLVYVASNTFLAVLLRIGWPSIVIWVFLWPSSYTVLCGVSCEEMGPGGWKRATAWGAHLSSLMRGSSNSSAVSWPLSAFQTPQGQRSNGIHAVSRHHSPRSVRRNRMWTNFDGRHPHRK